MLLKSVVQSIPSYVMQVFALPKLFCEELERMMNSFWWGNSNSTVGINWKSWDRLSVGKGAGGMGFCKVHQYNLSLLAKQGWRLLTCPDSLFARIYKAKYFPSTSFLEAKMGSNPRYTWRSILSSQDLIKKGALIRVGTGNSVRIWGSPWLIM